MKLDFQNMYWEFRSFVHNRIKFSYSMILIIFIQLFRFKADNIKEARITNSTFAHIPVKGMLISDANLLDIQDSTFERVTLQSIIVEKTKKVSTYR